MFVRTSQGPGPVRPWEIGVYVADQLSDLRGPRTGVVRLPIDLDWSPSPVYDLASKPQRELLYETVLREAGSEEDLAEWIDEASLASLWGELWLPDRVREAWESVHPALAVTD